MQANRGAQSCELQLVLLVLNQRSLAHPEDVGAKTRTGVRLLVAALAHDLAGPNVKLVGEGKTDCFAGMSLLPSRRVKPLDGGDSRPLLGRQKHDLIAGLNGAGFNGACENSAVVVVRRELVNVLDRKTKWLLFTFAFLDESIDVLKDGCVLREPTLPLARCYPHRVQQIGT